MISPYAFLRRGGCRVKGGSALVETLGLLLASVTVQECHEWSVGPEGVGERLDAWVAGRLAGTSRSQVGRALGDGRLTVNGDVPRKAGQRLRVGDVVVFVPAEERAQTLEPQDLPLPVLHLDEAIVVVDKPVGMVVHPSPGHPDGTLVNALLHHVPDLQGGAADRPGIVHRIDQDTSGLLVIARTESDHAHLGRQFHDHTVHRRYLAVIHGHRLADAGTHETLYGRHRRDRKRMSGQVESGRRACTHWRVLARSEAFALVVCRLETGRTHQIRVHMSEAGYPVVGDSLYGRRLGRAGKARLVGEVEAARALNRQALHAASLGFQHPRSGAFVRFESPLPEDMATLVGTLFGVDMVREAVVAAQS